MVLVLVLILVAGGGLVIIIARRWATAMVVVVVVTGGGFCDHRHGCRHRHRREGGLHNYCRRWGDTGHYH